MLTFIHHNQVCENALSEIFVPVHEERVAGGGDVKMGTTRDLYQRWRDTEKEGVREMFVDFIHLFKLVIQTDR